jgi:hypothetical protein
MLYPEMLHKYSVNDDWQELYASYIDKKMTNADRLEFDDKFFVPERLQTLLLLRLLAKMK